MSHFNTGRHGGMSAAGRIRPPLALLLLAAGCAAPPRGPAPPPLLPKLLLAALRARAESIRTASGILSLRTEGLDRDGRCEAALAVAYPDRLRLRAFNGATTVLDFVLQGDAYETRLQHEDRVVRGTLVAGPERTALPHSERTRLRFYQALADLLSRGRDGAAASYTLTDDVYTLSFPRGDRRQVLTIDRRTLDIVRHRIEPEGGPAVEVETNDYREAAPGLRWPYRVTVRGEGEPRFTVKMRFHDVTVNAPLPPGAFEMTAPEEAKGEPAE